MKRVISILLSILFLLFVYIQTFPVKQVQENEVCNTQLPKAIDTKVFLDYSQLYTCRPYEGTDSCIEVTIQDADLLMKIARSEGGPTLDGQLWAMRVIYNRLFDGGFGNSIWEIVSSAGQFDVFTDGSYINADINSNTHLALAMIESGWNETQGALYWRMDKDSEGSWHDNNLQYITTVDGNRYYK